MNQQIEGKLRKKGYEFLEMTSETTDSVWDKPFHKWFWECVLGNSSEEYRREFWREAHCGHTIGPVPRTFGRPDIPTYSGLPYARVVESDLAFRLVFLMIPGSFFWLLRLVLRGTLRKLRRPSYYERERDRRIELGRQRRSITLRTTVNAKPSFDDIRAAWNGDRHAPEGALRLGGLMEDLECFVCNLTIGNAVEGYRGRHGGIKRLLQDKAPDLFDHYTSLMRYKSIARRFRQACGLRDPNPVDAVLPLSAPPRKGNVRKNWSDQISRADGSQVAETKGAEVTDENWSEQISRADGSQVAETKGAEVTVENWSEQISRADGSQVGETKGAEVTVENWSGQISRGERGRVGETKVRENGMTCGEASESTKPSPGVKTWVLDGFVFGYKKGCWLEKGAFEVAVRVLRACENSVISLEAALALEIDPNCVTTEFRQAEQERVKRVKLNTERQTKAGTERQVKKIGPNESRACLEHEAEREDAKIGPNESRACLEHDAEREDAKIGPNESRACLEHEAEREDAKIGPNESRGCQVQAGDERRKDMPYRVLNWLRRRMTA